MRVSTFLAVAASTNLASAGFATYKLIAEGQDNSGELAYWELDRSNTLFLYIQLLAGGDHQSVINDFKTLAQNYGSHGVSVIPRVRYGNPDGSEAPEPEDANLILQDVQLWSDIFADIAGTIEIPVIQAGFLGLWGEWHSGPFSNSRGEEDSEENKQLKKSIVETLRASGNKVALRYPEDHYQLYRDDRSVTIHNDCILNAGPEGGDGGTFPDEDRDFWKDYTVQVAGSNTYGGEGCNQADDSTYDWEYDDVCGDNGLVAYIHKFQMSYINPGNPQKLQDLFYDENYAWCVDAIGAAMDQYP